MRICLMIWALSIAGCAETETSPPRPAVDNRGVVVADGLPSSQQKAVDALVNLTVQRLELMSGVASYKWNHKLPIDNRERETELLAKLVAQGTAAGVSEEIVIPFFEQQFLAAKQLQAVFFDVWEGNPSVMFDDVPDLAIEIRPKIDRISAEMIAQLAVLKPVWDQETVRQAFDEAIGRFEVAPSREDGEELVEAVRMALKRER